MVNNLYGNKLNVALLLWYAIDRPLKLVNTIGYTTNVLAACDTAVAQTDQNRKRVSNGND